MTQIILGSGFNSKDEAVNILPCLDYHSLDGDKGDHVKVRWTTNYSGYPHTCPSTRNNSKTVWQTELRLVSTTQQFEQLEVTEKYLRYLRWWNVCIFQPASLNSCTIFVNAYKRWLLQISHSEDIIWVTERDGGNYTRRSLSQKRRSKEGLFLRSETVSRTQDINHF